MGKGSHKGHYSETQRSNGFGSHDLFCKSCIEDRSWLIKRSNIDYHTKDLVFCFDTPATLSLNKSFLRILLFHAVKFWYPYLSCLVVFSVFIMSSAFSPLATILTQNKLTRNNFIDWKRNLDIVLTAEDHVYVLTTPFPKNLWHATATAGHEFDKWRKSNGMACCYMLAFMASILQP